MEQNPRMPSDFTYDHFGNTKTNVSGGNTTNYIWDYESHLLSIDYPGTTNDDSHEYDGDGRRMRSKLNGASEWTNFIHDEVGGGLLAEYTLISGVYTVKALYTNGLGLISTNREGVKRYFHFDGLGSTWALTDENENVKDSYSYSAFGVTVSATSTNGPSTNPMRFVGRWGYYDDTAMGSQGGLSLLGVRYFSPSSGRFLSWDPIRSTNNYWYADNRSDAVDPTGLDCRLRKDWRMYPPLIVPVEPFFLLRCASCLRSLVSTGVLAGELSGLPGRAGGEADAFRHCWGACAAVRKCGCKCARFLDLRENKALPADCMDLHNNRIGRTLGDQAGSCWDLCWGAYLSGKLTLRPCTEHHR